MRGGGSAGSVVRWGRCFRHERSGRGLLGGAERWGIFPLGLVGGKQVCGRLEMPYCNCRKVNTSPPSLDAEGQAWGGRLGNGKFTEDNTRLDSPTAPQAETSAGPYTMSSTSPPTAVSSLSRDQSTRPTNYLPQLVISPPISPTHDTIHTIYHLSRPLSLMQSLASHPPQSPPLFSYNSIDSTPPHYSPGHSTPLP